MLATKRSERGVFARWGRLDARRGGSGSGGTVAWLVGVSTDAGHGGAEAHDGGVVRLLLSWAGVLLPGSGLGPNG